MSLAATVLASRRRRPGWLAGLCALCLLFASACHLLRAPRRAVPRLGADIRAGTLHVAGRERRYLLYVPKQRKPAAPLVVLLHGSRQTAQGLRASTGYAFDRLADQHGFVAVYPDGYRRRWNDCRAGGRYAARRLQIDDVGFLASLIDTLQASAQIDPTRVFLAGYSGGGQLAFRMATERPERIAGIAAFGANLPTQDNWACASATRAVPVMLINGTSDRINPYEGGKVTVFGFASRGTVRSARESAEHFAALAGVRDAERRRLSVSAETWVEQFRWHRPDAAEVVLLAVHGGGHVVPGPRASFPRILGKVSAVLDGPQAVWDFFARQPASRPK